MTAARALQICAVLLLGFPLPGCQSARQAPSGCYQAHENLDAVLWRQTSAEYRAVAEQTYRSAMRQLDTALKEAPSTWTAALEQQGDYSRLPPAIIIDVDETILDTSPFQTSLVKSGRPFRLDQWNAWVREGKSGAIPGALEFVRHAKSRGVRIFYLTNRDHDVEEATRQTLEDLGFPADPDGENILTKYERAEWGSEKTSRRAFIARNHRVILIIGDDLRDFAPEAKSDPEVRAELVSRYRPFWGTKWFMLPNPIYGSWERALYGYESLPPGERLRRKYDILGPSK